MVKTEGKKTVKPVARKGARRASKAVADRKESKALAQTGAPSFLSQITGMKGPQASATLLNQILPMFLVRKDLDENDRQNVEMAIFEILDGISPESDIEGMLAAQMIGTHNAAMECLRRAMLPNQTIEGRDQNLKHAAKLLSIYAQQMGALDKHRGKGQQKMTVEYVNVESGGQAVVGNVKAGEPRRRRKAPKKCGPKSITHNPADVFELPPTSADEEAKETQSVRTSSGSKHARKP